MNPWIVFAIILLVALAILGFLYYKGSKLQKELFLEAIPGGRSTSRAVLLNPTPRSWKLEPAVQIAGIKPCLVDTKQRELVGDVATIQISADKAKRAAPGKQAAVDDIALLDLGQARCGGLRTTHRLPMECAFAFQTHPEEAVFAVGSHRFRTRNL